MPSSLSPHVMCILPVQFWQSLHPLRHGAMFYEGSIAEAIAEGRREGKPLIVLLTGDQEGLHRLQSSAQLWHGPRAALAACAQLAVAW